jgi:hypothetical protein
MNVGLPGSGVGGLFYLLSALCMPIVEATRGLAPRPGSQWRVVGRLTVMAVGIAAGIWWAGWVLALMVSGSPLLAAAMHGAGIDGRFAPNVLRTATLVMSLSTLAAIIVSVWVARLVTRPGRKPRRTQRPHQVMTPPKWKHARKVAESDAA